MTPWWKLLLWELLIVCVGGVIVAAISQQGCFQEQRHTPPARRHRIPEPIKVPPQRVEP